MKQHSVSLNEVRIIAGQWRGRKITFPSIEGLRPTSDRLRETLFNWLQFEIQAKNCLDLFAGSGALGFEALSRGAKLVTFLDTAPEVIAQLNNQSKVFDCQNSSIICQDGIKYLENTTQQFDLIFLDPPFQLEIWLKCLNIIEKKRILKPNGKIYLETPITKELNLSPQWKELKVARAGQVIGRLLTLNV